MAGLEPVQKWPGKAKVDQAGLNDQAPPVPVPVPLTQALAEACLSICLSGWSKLMNNKPKVHRFPPRVLCEVYTWKSEQW